MLDLLNEVVSIVAADAVGAATTKYWASQLDKSAIVRGVDENNNGVRDDFERLIGDKVKDPKQRNMLFHMLSYMDKNIEFGLTKAETDKEEALALFKEYDLVNVFQCLSRDNQTYYTFISNNYANTKERYKALTVYNKAFLKNKYRAKAGKVDCDAFAASIPNYTVNELTVKVEAPKTETATN